jgi:hypothetical protein
VSREKRAPHARVNHMKISHEKAVYAGVIFILIAIGFQLFNDFACYKKSIVEALLFLWFPAIPLITAIASLKSKNPLRAIPSSLSVIPFYLMAYNTDCVQPYKGGGASMIYVVVIMYGTPVAFVCAFIADGICRLFNIRITRTDKPCSACGTIVKADDSYCSKCGKKNNRLWIPF